MAIKFFDIFDKKKILVTALKILCVILVIIVACRSVRSKCDAYYEAEIQRITDDYEAELYSLATQAENGLYKSTALADDYTEDSEALARLIGGTVPNHSSEAKAALCWLVFNRMENPIFPDTVLGVIQQAGQFDTYSETAPITQADYVLAHNELMKYMTGDYRLISPGFVYLTCGESSITIRDEWDVDNAHSMEIR